MTQDAARQLVAGAHGLLQTRTEALWGGPIALLEDSQASGGNSACSRGRA